LYQIIKTTQSDLEIVYRNPMNSVNWSVHNSTIMQPYQTLT